MVGREHLSVEDNNFLSNGDISDDANSITAGPVENNPEAAHRQDDKESELMLLEAVMHIKMARSHTSD